MESSLENALRVLVGLTHGSQAWNRKLLRQEYFLPFLMRTIMTSHREYLRPDHPRGAAMPSEEESQALDYFCLALGICTNFVQNTDEASDVYREIRTSVSKWCSASVLSE